MDDHSYRLRRPRGLADRTLRKKASDRSIKYRQLLTKAISTWGWGGARPRGVGVVVPVAWSRASRPSSPSTPGATCRTCSTIPTRVATTPLGRA